MTLLLVIVLICVLAEGFFSGSEIAIVSLNKAGIQHNAAQGSRRAKLLLDMLEKPELLIGTTLLGTNLSTVSANFAMNEIFARTFDPSLSWLSVFIIFPVILFFGEILPKAYYRKHAETIAYLIVEVLLFFSLVFRPFIMVLSWCGNGVRKMITGKQDTRAPFITREEFEMILEQDRYSLNEDQIFRMLANLTSYLDRTVEEITIPMVNVTHCLPGDSYRTVVENFTVSGFSKLPVYDKDQDEIIGIIDDLNLLDSRNRKKNASQVANETICIPENLDLSRALLKLRLAHKEMATVIDEYGGTVGIVTLKDIIKEITGKLSDEDEVSHGGYIHRVNANVLIVDAQFRLAELGNYSGKEFAELPVETINGLISLLLGRIPARGDKCNFENLEFQVLRAKKQKAEMIKIQIGKEKYA